MAEVIRAGKSGIKNPNSPVGVFLLVGPSGVGKTETGLALADLLFGGERNVVTINMSEFTESYTVSSLIGAAPGPGGVRRGRPADRGRAAAALFRGVARRGRKGPPGRHEPVLQRVRQGVLTDGEGKEVNFKNTVMILTSNLGTDVIRK